MEVIQKALPLLLIGAVASLQITVLAVSIGSALGLAAGLAKLSKNRIAGFIATCYVDFFRGTPLFVQIMLVYFGLPQLLADAQTYLMNQYGLPRLLADTNLSIFFAAILVTSLNSGAYIAEIFRAGVQSIDKGQMEAARSLGMTSAQAMRYVILPQAFKRVIPPMGNEFIAMLKDTSLLSVIGFQELARKGQLVVADTYASFEIWLTVALIYLIMTITFSRFVSYMERRLQTGD